MFNADEFQRIYRALVHARDTAFIGTNDKDHETVKRWEALMERTKQEAAERDIVLITK